MEHTPLASTQDVDVFVKLADSHTELESEKVLISTDDVLTKLKPNFPARNLDFLDSPSVFITLGLYKTLKNRMPLKSAVNQAVMV